MICIYHYLLRCTHQEMSAFLEIVHNYYYLLVMNILVQFSWEKAFIVEC